MPWRMARILRTGASLTDLDRIYDYVSASSPQNADVLIRDFECALLLLADTPNIGKARPELSEGLRSWPVHRFIIFYTPSEDAVIVIRVLHAAMDISTQHFAEN
jgi:toxin ParE1/3/4